MNWERNSQYRGLNEDIKRETVEERHKGSKEKGYDGGRK